MLNERGLAASNRDPAPTKTRQNTSGKLEWYDQRPDQMIEAPTRTAALEIIFASVGLKMGELVRLNDDIPTWWLCCAFDWDQVSPPK